MTETPFLNVSRFDPYRYSIINTGTYYHTFTFGVCLSRHNLQWEDPSELGSLRDSLRYTTEVLDGHLGYLVH